MVRLPLGPEIVELYLRESVSVFSGIQFVLMQGVVPFRIVNN